MEITSLEETVQSLGYEGIEDFLNDNPGAVDLILVFIGEKFPGLNLEEFV